LNNLNEDDESVISSDECEENEAMFKLMDADQKKPHIIDLWRRTHLKSRGGSLVLRFYHDLSKKIYLFGVSKRLDDAELEEKPAKWVI
jgi:phosphoribosyl 1,2-cyclic phosphodiesterase